MKSKLIIWTYVIVHNLASVATLVLGNNSNASYRCLSAAYFVSLFSKHCDNHEKSSLNIKFPSYIPVFTDMQDIYINL